ncbi:MAG: SCP2 sterol-binding domain-containing protein [Proteobacteria bacterium]|nr:SCP2 sterol-binding domain-containing protein [Pseudomonadota bacterium]
MATLEEITEKMREAVAGGGLDQSVKFDLGADGVIHMDGSTVSNENKPADCTLTLSKADFEAMGRKELDPTMAFMSGRLKIAGDMGVAMKLQPILSRVG